MCSRKQFRMNCFENLFDLITFESFRNNPNTFRVHATLLFKYAGPIKNRFRIQSSRRPKVTKKSYILEFVKKQNLRIFAEIRNSVVTP